jgi:hypothetical protein
MRCLAIAGALLACSCGLTGPSDDLTGHWIARSIGHGSSVGLTLAQTGDDIGGSACAISDGHLLYSGAPVSGDYPDVRFIVGSANAQPCCPTQVGVRFTGRRDSTTDIVGSYGTFDLRFERSPVPLCN